MLTVQDLYASFDDLAVLRGINLDVEQGEIVCLLGPSGCGKTTLLRVIAGLQAADRGDVLVNGVSVMQTPVHRRDFGLMFQDFALFPHVNVAGNIAFGLKMHGMSRHEQQRRVQEMLAVVGLSGLGERDVSQLSGGERQRVALARSLAPKPHLLMLDEPLGSLDAALRERLVVELRDIIKGISQTALYVTHDQHEAFAIADRIAIMNAGVIEQIGTAESIYKKPATVFTAQFLGLTNILNVLAYHANGVTTSIGDFDIPGKPGAILLHPDGIALVSADTPGAIRGRVRERVFMGDSYRLQVEINLDTTFTIKAVANGENPPGHDDLVALWVNPATIIPLDGLSAR